MQANDVMTSPVVTVTQDTPVHDIVRLLTTHRISAVPVVDAQQHVVGIVSEGDLLAVRDGSSARQAWWLAALMLGGTLDYEKIHASTAGEVMTSRVVTVEQDTPLSEIARTLERYHIKRVPVVHDGVLVGIVSRANLLHGMADVIIERHEPGARADRLLRAHVVDALRHEPLLEPYLINVTVNDGAIVLWGVVDREETREAAERIARQVTGVHSVVNHLGAGPVSGLPV